MRASVRAALATALAWWICAAAAPSAWAITHGQEDRGDEAVVAILAAKTGVVLCTGTLVTPELVLTAAHCLTSADELAVSFELDPWADDAPAAVGSVEVHPGFDPSARTDDIGVAVLESASEVRPAALPDAALDEAIVGRPLRIVGFGLGDPSDTTSASKRQGTSEVDTLKPGSLSLVRAPSQPCVGDSGGPAFAGAEGAETLIGVTSWGDAACAEHAWQTRVDVHVDGFLRPHLHGTAPRDQAAPSCHAAAPGGRSGALSPFALFWLAALGLRRARAAASGARRYTAPLLPGDLVAERYQVVELAARGGMGVIYRAIDRRQGRAVALKVLAASADVARFARERAILARLFHPAIVAYLDSGQTAAGQPWLATEWIEGETLSTKVSKGPLEPSEVVALGGRIADALRLAHEQGVIHRDVKPSNILLPDGDIARAKLGDFGVSRAPDVDVATTTGVTLGTPGYMAPEQARGARDIDPRADLFALGCVLYRCLAGSDAFAGDDVLAVLVQTILHEPEPLRLLAPRAPGWLVRLTERLLSKSPDARPASAAAVLAALSAAAADDDTDPSDALAQGAAVSAWERVLCCFAVARPAPTTLGEETTQRFGTEASDTEALWGVVEGCGGRMVRLASGVIIVSAHGPAADQAATVARCGLAIQQVSGDQLAIAVVTSETPRSPAGRLIGDASSGQVDRSAALSAAEIGGVLRLDAAAARLIERRFEVLCDERGPYLSREREAPAAATFLGRVSPFVGRDREIALLEGLFDAAVRAPSAHAALLVGEPGIGKSRIVRELLRRLGARAMTVWSAGGEPLGAGSAFRLVSAAIAGAAGLEPADCAEARWDKLGALLGSASAAERERRLPFLAEIVGPRWPPGRSAELDAARADVKLMNDRLRAAVVDLLASAAARGPLVIVLEDVHWGDAASLEAMGAALRRSLHAALFVLATARPEIDRAAVASWRRVLHEVPILELPRSEAERFASQVGTAAPPDVVASIVDRAAGNPLWLEELIREHAEGRRGAAGHTLLTLVQARLETLRPEVRRALRAASVFGRAFRTDAVADLLGAASDQVHLLLAEAEERELVTMAAPPSSTPGTRGAALAFRHALFAEATYAMLPADDRVRAHRAAARWLTRTAEHDALAIAEHHVLGDEPRMAAPWYRRAAERALAADDYASALHCAGRGVDCLPEADELGRLRLLEAEAHRWHGDATALRSAAALAIRLAPPDSAQQYRAMGLLSLAVGRAGDRRALEALALELRPADDAAAPDRADDEREQVELERARAWARICIQLTVLNSPLTAQVVGWLDPYSGRWPALDGWIGEARGLLCMRAGQLDQQLAATEAAIAAFNTIGDRRNAVEQRVHLGIFWTFVGDHQRAIAEFDRAQEEAAALGLDCTLVAGLPAFGIALWYGGQHRRARTHLEHACKVLADRGNRVMHASARFALAHVLLQSGEVAAAEREARAGIAAPVPTIFSLQGPATLAEILLRSGRPREAVELLRNSPCADPFHPWAGVASLTLALALHATGEIDAAKRCIADARDGVLALAARSPSLRDLLLASPYRALTLTLARQWLGE